MNIAHTRNMVRAALDGSLADVPTVIDPVFRVAVPTEVPGVPSERPRSRATRGPIAAAYDVAAAQDRRTCSTRTSRPTPSGVSQAVRDAGPDRGPTTPAQVPVSAPDEG